MKEEERAVGGQHRLNLGKFELCLNVGNLQRALDFYSKLDFENVGGEREQGWVVLEHSNLRLALYQGHIDRNMMNFRGGDAFLISKKLRERGLKMKTEAVMESDGSSGATIEDPDGNLIYFNTYPDEAMSK